MGDAEMSDFAEDLQKRVDWIKKPFHTTIDWQNVANLLNCELTEADAKISEMKCCGNCKYYSLIYCSVDCKSISTEFVKQGLVKEKKNTDKCDKWRFWK